MQEIDYYIVLRLRRIPDHNKRAGNEELSLMDIFCEPCKQITDALIVVLKQSSVAETNGDQEGV